MKRAVEVFALEARPSRSPLVERTWWTRSPDAGSFLSVATVHWEMVVTRQRGRSRLTVRGPETRATAVPIPPDAQFFGIDFSVGTFLPALPPGGLVDRAVALPAAAGRWSWLDDSVWDLPGPDTADALVAGLARAGVLAHDPVVAEALRGEVPGYSTRSLERRVARATGLNRGTVGRIRRAERALDLLSRGVPASQAAHRAGYADQPHLTRSLRRLVGQTPSQIAVAGVQDPGGRRGIDTS